MAKGYALLIGMGSVDAFHYGGWSGELKQPEQDVEIMKEIAASQGFEVQTLLSKEAIRENVVSSIKRIAEKMASTDLFFLYFSGHGGQIPDLNGDEEDGLDETWCLYDGELLDDELYALWGCFKEDSRVIVISDSCHSGTVTKALPCDNSLISKSLPWAYVFKTFDLNKSFYEKIVSDVPGKGSINIKSSIYLMASSRDNQSSYAFREALNSLFTASFRELWSTSKPDEGYESMLEAIGELLREEVGRMQTPEFYAIGEENIAFKKQPVLAV